VKPGDIPQVREDILFRELDDGCVLYDPASEKVHALNQTAGLLWCLIDGNRSVAEMAETLAEASGADAEQVLGDAIRTLEGFERQGLLV
jgi:PqqD family protein of HPr-rel-A system